MKSEKSVLISFPGFTDPITGDYDGPILHIMRYYRPWKVYLLFTKEMWNREIQYGTLDKAIEHFSSKNNLEVQIEKMDTGIVDANSYDSFSQFVVDICEKVSHENEDSTVLLNISSGTPQLKSALCMMAISDDKYRSIQVNENIENRKKEKFDPKQHDILKWLDNNYDDLEESPSRCQEPGLTNFKKPMVKLQIKSLISNYDYSGALQLIRLNEGMFPDRLEKLIEHADKRLILDFKSAEQIAKEIGMDDTLYSCKRRDIRTLVDYYNSISVKQKRSELNDMVLRLEVMIEYLALYILEKIMKINVDSITNEEKRPSGKIRKMSKEKCSQIQGLVEYLDKRFANTPSKGFEWGKPISGISILSIIGYISSNDERYYNYKQQVSKINEWMELSLTVRNLAAHTIVCVDENEISNNYKGNSASLCNDIRKVMSYVFKTEAPENAFDIYESINKLALELLNSK